MFKELLNRDIILGLAKSAQRQLEAEVAEGQTEGRRGRTEDQPEGTEILTTDDYDQALQQVTLALQNEQAASSGQPGFAGPPSERLVEKPANIDEASFFSRDPVISNLQSAFDQLCEERRPDLIVEEETAPAGTRSGLPEPISPRSLNISPLGARRVGEQFSVTDIRWVNSLVAQQLAKLRGRHPFNEQPAEPLDIADNARVVLLGDWGSGIPRAIKIANQIRTVLAEGTQTGREQHVIHLGDVYYSGWQREYENRFLKPWPVDVSQAGVITSWSTNANHDMYSGGHGYYQVLLGDERFARQQRSSFFSLRNHHWNLLGLDTAYEDHALKDPQAAWVRGLAAESDRKLMLLSHHQPFSSYEGDGPKLVEQLQPVLTAGRINSWFWGHEHRCMLYKPHLGVKFGRCLGHAGVPVYMWHQEEDPVPEPGAYEYRERFHTNPLEPWSLFGFAVLDFAGPYIHVRYINENGVVHKTEEIS